MIQLVLFYTSPLLVDAGILSLLTNANNPFPSAILLNKWQRQKEKDYQRWLAEKEYQRQQEEEWYERK